MLKDVLARARHYWYVVLIGGLVSLLAAGTVLFMLPASYEATRSVLFVPSPTSENPDEPLNPFFSYMTESLATSISVVSIVLNDKRTQEEIAPPGSGIDYTAGQMIAATAPILEIVATADSKQAADGAADQLVETANATLESQQRDAGAPKRTWISTSLISSTIEPERVWSKPARFSAIVLALGLLTTFWIVSRLWRRQQAADNAWNEASVPEEADAAAPVP